MLCQRKRSQFPVRVFEPTGNRARHSQHDFAEYMSFHHHSTKPHKHSTHWNQATTIQPVFPTENTALTLDYFRPKPRPVAARGKALVRVKTNAVGYVARWNPCCCLAHHQHHRHWKYLLHMHHRWRPRQFHLPHLPLSGCRSPAEGIRFPTKMGRKIPMEMDATNIICRNISVASSYREKC